MLEITKNNFAVEVENCEIPVIVDFFADWCPPCQIMAQVFAELDAEADGFKVAKVNADRQPELVQRFGIEFLPTVLIFDKGVAIEKSVGFKNKEALKAMLKLKIGF